MDTPRRSITQSRNSQKRRTDLEVDPENVAGFEGELEQEMAKVVAELSDGKLKNWNDAKLKKQTEGLIIANLEALDASRVRRRRLFTRDAVLARDEARDEIILSRLPRLLDVAVQLLPLSEQAAGRATLNQALATLREEIAAALQNDA